VDLFGYKGKFQVKWLQVPPEPIPNDILPRRLEKRNWPDEVARLRRRFYFESDKP
jgi:hypothetical protein